MTPIFHEVNVVQRNTLRTFFFSVTTVSFVAFLCCFYLYSLNVQLKEEEQLHQHAKIMAERVWAMDRIGVYDYLDLINQLESYKYISITEKDGSPFAQSFGAPLGHIEKSLLATHLIQLQNLETEIFYDGEMIGFLQSQKYHNLASPALNIFIIIFFLTALLVSFLRTYKGKSHLTKSLQTRTKKLAESETRFEEFLNFLPEIVWETNNQGEIVYINQQGKKRFSIPNILNTPFHLLFCPEEQSRVQKDFQHALTGQTIGFNEVRAQDREGNIFPLFLRWSILLHNEHVQGLRILGVDLSERVEFEKQLEKDRRIKELGMMAGGVAHDLNNILSGVVGYADLLLLDKAAPPSETSMVRDIKKAGMQAAEVVENLLMVVRGGSVIREEADLVQIVNDYLNSPDFQRLKKEKVDITFKVDIDVKKALLLCSPIQIRKILMNILINATEAIHDEKQGHIRFRLYSREFTQRFTCINGDIMPGSYVCLSFEDNGIGIAPAIRDKIFEPFYSNKKMGTSGTGLGMSLVWNAVGDHQGGLVLRHLSPGTLIKIYLPITHTLLIEDDKVDENKTIAYHGAGETILIVDDDPRQCFLGTTILSSLGYQTTSVSSGEEALKWLSQNKVDLLVLDMLLGDGIDGATTYAKALKIHSRQKAIIVSAFANRSDVAQVLQKGAHTLVHKPYTIEQIARAVHDALHA